MKKTLFPLVGLGIVLVVGSCAGEVEQKSDCESKCEAVSEICSGVITYEECKNGCDGCGVAVLDEIENEQDCGEVKEKISQCVSIGKEEPVGNNCEAACHNYNNQCLVHVPNADQELFDQGFESCMAVCKDWAEEKVECMVDAQDCPSMTEVCGL